jgi:hypothetical protein
MHNTLESAARSLKNAPFGPKWNFKAKHAAANISLPMHQYGRSFPFSRWRFRVKQTAGTLSLSRKN